MAVLAVFILLAVLVTPVALLFISTSLPVRCVTLGVTALFLVGAYAEALKPEADIPPCHMMLPFTLWAVAAYRHWLRPRKRESPPGRCPKCRYDLTDNVTGTCPECGTPVPKQSESVPPATTPEKRP